MAEKLYQQVAALSRLPKDEPASSKVACRSASWDDFEGVRDWLRARPVSGDTAILVSWRFSGDAVIARWHIFCKYWDDFCYPSSDDVIIWPLSGAWALEYRHFEEFCFAERMELAQGDKFFNAMPDADSNT